MTPEGSSPGWLPNPCQASRPAGTGQVENSHLVGGCLVDSKGVHHSWVRSCSGVYRRDTAFRQRPEQAQQAATSCGGSTHVRCDAASSIHLVHALNVRRTTSAGRTDGLPAHTQPKLAFASAANLIFATDAHWLRLDARQDSRQTACLPRFRGTLLSNLRTSHWLVSCASPHAPELGSLYFPGPRPTQRRPTC